MRSLSSQEISHPTGQVKTRLLSNYSINSRSVLQYEVVRIWPRMPTVLSNPQQELAVDNYTISITRTLHQPGQGQLRDGGVLPEQPFHGSQEGEE
jgi:hypothetical protein